jgi:hypothetical protein
MDMSEFDDIPVERVCAAAVEKCSRVVVVLGVTDEGEAYFASSISSADEVMRLLDLAKEELPKCLTLRP